MFADVKIIKFTVMEITLEYSTFQRKLGEIYLV